MYDSTKNFEEIANVDKPRSRFERSCGHKTSYDTGQLIPVYWDEVLPGDTISLDIAHVTRMTTPIVPVMDNAVMDIYAFFVPNRLVWPHWLEFCGENKTTHWEQPVQYTIPQILSPASGFDDGSLADYLGIPTHVGGLSVNHLPFRTYCKIFNDWFRDENLKDPIMFNDDETTLQGINKGNNYDYVTDTQLGAYPVNAAKFHDYFTSALPEPQKGPDVFVPLGQSAPVLWGDKTSTGVPVASAMVGTEVEIKDYHSGGIRYAVQSGIKSDGTAVNPGSGEGNNMVADLSNATGATINQLRQAFAIQRFYERLALGGSRYTEFVRNIFGVVSPDARQQRSEFLGAKRFQINMDQVLQTSATDAVSPQGNTAAYSCTVNADDLFTYSATEHGHVMIMAVIRTTHTYQYGLEKAWNRKKFTDYYVPQFAHLGEMPILNKEIFAQGSSVVDADGNVVDEQVFGYQEAWAEYRYKPNRVSGKLRSQATGSLDVWTYADKYSQLPMLSAEWIDETKANLQRSLAVQNEPQFYSDFYFKATWTRVMPLNSVPGLIDHY